MPNYKGKPPAGDWWVQQFEYMNITDKRPALLRMAWKPLDKTSVHTSFNYICTKEHDPPHEWSGWHGCFHVQISPQHGYILEFDWEGDEDRLEQMNKHTAVWGSTLTGKDYAGRKCQIRKIGDITMLNPDMWDPDVLAPSEVGGFPPSHRQSAASHCLSDPRPAEVSREVAMAPSDSEGPATMAASEAPAAKYQRHDDGYDPM